MAADDVNKIYTKPSPIISTSQQTYDKDGNLRGGSTPPPPIPQDFLYKKPNDFQQLLGGSTPPPPIPISFVEPTVEMPSVPNHSGKSSIKTR